MQNFSKEKIHLFNRAYPVCCKRIPEDKWHQLTARTESLQYFSDTLDIMAAELQLPPYLRELARLEFYVFSLAAGSERPDEFADNLTVNPTLELFANSWKNLATQINEAERMLEPEKGDEHVIVWRHPAKGGITVKPADKEDLLVMKMAIEKLSVHDVVQHGGIHAAAVEAACIRALDAGLVIGPEPGIKRHFKPENYQNIDPAFFRARIFSLQWHITQDCDLHCLHCYDRNQYKSLALEQELAVLDDLSEFCSFHKVHGQVTFTGGNPLLHPNFERLYQEAGDRGFTLAILGNPTSREQLERLNDLQPPAFYQVSLEGLTEHNDYIRGRGHFKRILTFLDLLKDLGVFSMVMLTLTRDNIEQVLALADILRDKTDLFTFNRLSLVGEGANLLAAPKEKYPDFLKTYADAAGTNPCLGLKDNLLNVLYYKQGRQLFGGCTGFGCGAAFNFITVLADGSVHACRKFPSPLGNILDNKLKEIYYSETAKRYRGGAAECSGCSIRPVCGGCLAVSHSHDLDIFTEKDPYCFMDSKEPTA